MARYRVDIGLDSFATVVVDVEEDEEVEAAAEAAMESGRVREMLMEVLRDGAACYTVLGWEPAGR